MTRVGLTRKRQPVSLTQEDPIGLAGGLNLYGFAAGDPVGYSDPFGLSDCKDRKTGKDLPEARCKPDDEPLVDESWNTFQAFSGIFGVARGLIGRAIAAAASAFGRKQAGEIAGRFVIPEGEAIIAVVKDGKILAQSHAGLSHADLVKRTLGELPEGARVVTVGKYQGQIQVLNSRTFHGNQLPAPQDVVVALRNIFR